MAQQLVRPAVVYGAEQCLLLIVVFRYKKCVGCGEEGALVYAIILTEGFYFFLIHIHYPCQLTLFIRSLIA